jgi:hypothetical protein
MRNSTLSAPSDPYQAVTNSDIVMSQSFDRGNTWSAPTALAIPNDQFMPWGAYNASGQLQIGFFDRSYDPANHEYGYTLASETTPGSLHFTLQEVSTALSDPTQGDSRFRVTVNSSFPNATSFMGDYSNIAISPNGVAALWTDMRLQATSPAPFIGWNEDAFFALVTIPAPPATASAAAPKLAVAALSSVIAPAGTIRAEVGIFNLPPVGSATAMRNENVQAYGPAPVVAIWQWLMSEPLLPSAAPLTVVPSIPSSAAPDAQPNASLWNDPFAALVLSF